MTSLLMRPNDDLFLSNAGALVNPVNCVGISGKGLALLFKQRFPENFRKYKTFCDARELSPGGLHFTRPEGDRSSLPSPYIVNLATKDHWRDASQLEWIRAGVENLKRWATDFRVSTIACPALGSGEGGLDWPKVQAVIEKGFESSPIEILIYPPRK